MIFLTYSEGQNLNFQIMFLLQFSHTFGSFLGPVLDLFVNPASFYSIGLVSFTIVLFLWTVFARFKTI